MSKRDLHGRHHDHQSSLPGIDRVPALADISRSALCCHSNETPAPTANPPNSAQLEGNRYHSPSYIRVRAVVWKCGQGQTHARTHRRPWPIYISPRLCLTLNVITGTNINRRKERVSGKLNIVSANADCCHSMICVACSSVRVRVQQGVTETTPLANVTHGIFHNVV